jgi:hypothetical protein
MMKKIRHVANRRRAEDELAESQVAVCDQTEEAEPADDEGHKMAERIWAKVLERVPQETR